LSKATLTMMSKTQNLFLPIFVILIFFIVNKGTLTSSSSSQLGSGGPANTQGPWFECMSMIGSDCASFIRKQTNGNVKINFLHVSKDGIYESKGAAGKDPNHVFIYINEKNVVQETPARGG